VESGALKYRADRPGFAIMESSACESPNGHSSGGGRFAIDDEGMALVEPRQALISDAVPMGPIANGGSVPLVMLQMTLVPPQIDPATGQPMPGPVVLARAEAREREAHKQACRAAANPSIEGETPATLTLVPIARATDLQRTRSPKACRI
jgi:hypothetical protein